MGTTPFDGTDPAERRPMSLEEIRESYAECAGWADRFDWLDRTVTGRYRRKLFGGARGRVLDVACGTGTNFPSLPPEVDLVGIDVSPEMLAKPASASSASRSTARSTRWTHRRSSSTTTVSTPSSRRSRPVRSPTP